MRRESSDYYMPSLNSVLAGLRRRANHSYALVQEWVADAEEPFSTPVELAVDKGLLAFAKESIKTPISNLAPSLKFCRSILGCYVEFSFWKEKGGGAESHQEQRYAHLCFAWVHMVLACHNGRIPRSMKCNFLLFEAVRRFPASPLALVSMEHCNGGVTYLGRDDAEICVFRKEELFKVFVHETFHALGLHGPPVKPRAGDELAGLNTPCEMDYIEVYTEAWARVLNSVFTSIACPPHDNLVYLLEREAEHGWKQCKCVLERVSKNAKLVLKGGQPTPAFEYYCMAGSVVREWRGFLGWCLAHNPPCGATEKRSKHHRSVTPGIGFDLAKPQAWLGALGVFLETTLPTAAAEIEQEASARSACSGDSARMSINNPIRCVGQSGRRN